jgi:hypothetical protein
MVIFTHILVSGTLKIFSRGDHRFKMSVKIYWSKILEYLWPHNVTLAAKVSGYSKISIRIKTYRIRPYMMALLLMIN